MTRTHAPAALTLCALAAAAALAGCTAQPQYAIAPNGSAGPAGRSEPIRPEYAIAPGGSAGTQGRAEAPTPALSPPAAVASSTASGEEAPGPRVGAEPVDSAPLEAPPPAPPPPPPPAETAPSPPAGSARAYDAAAASGRREAEARRRRLVEAKARALLPARREPASNRYILAKGDTLYGVGRRFGVAPAELAHANALKLAATLRPGTAVVLPEDVHAGRATAGAKGEFVTTPGKAVAPTRAERAAALARAEALTPPVSEADPAPARLAAASPPAYRPYAPPAPPAGGRIVTASAGGVRSPAASSTDVDVPVASIRPPRGPTTAQAEAQSTPDAPRAYASLGPLGGRPAARGGSLPSSRSGGRTAQDAQAAYAVAAARAAQHGDIAGARTASAVASSGIESGRGRFSWPVKGEVISSFGPKGPGQRNDGVDIAAVDGEAVRAAAAGEVVYAGHDVPALGNLVAVKHADGWVTIYANLQRITVHPRDRVGQGGQVGLAGASGAAARPQVHFEVRYAPSAADKARPVDPQLVLPGASAVAVRAAG